MTTVRWRPLAAAGGVLVAWLAWVAVPGVSETPMPVASPASLPNASTVTAVPPADPSVIAQPTPDPTPSAAAVEANGEIPSAGSGVFVTAVGGTSAVGGGATLVRYSVEVEAEVPLDPAAVAARIDEILGDERSWIGLGRWTLQRVESDADARIVIATPDTVDRLCAPLVTGGRYSCRNGDYVVLNAARWAGGADSWGGDVDGYRGYLVNHEFGHYLGFSHTTCPAPGDPAPVMVQQTKSLFGCTPNAWPVVTGG